MSPSLTPSDQEAIDQIVSDVLAASGAPGAILGFWRGEDGYTQAYGVADLETGTPPTLHDHVRIASITKTFAGTVLLQLADEGRVALDTPLVDFDLEFPRSASATVADLLGMTSGIYDYTHDPSFIDRYNADPLMAFGPDDALAISRSHPPEFAPGTSVSYCDTNYIIAGKIAEQVSGMSIEHLIATRISEPYGLIATSFPTDPHMADPVMHGYSQTAAGGPLRDVTASNPNGAWAAGAMVSDLADLRLWARVLANGDLLSPEMQSARLQMRPLHPSQPIFYGLAIGRFFGFLGHNGGIAGYSSMMLHDPAVDTTIVALTNLSGLTGGAADTIAVKLIGHFFPDRVA